jgi:pilus assembly protein CpaB
VSWHRRSLAALAAALAVLAGVSAARPEGPPRVTAVVLQDELPGGVVLHPADLEGREILASDAPEGFLPTTGGLVGRTLAAPAAKGQILTALDLVSTRSPVASGHVVAALRLGDPGLVRLLRTGDVVDVLAADEQTREARLVAQAVRVVTVPAVDADASPEASSGLVLVEVSASTATALAQATVNSSLTVTWR